MSEIDYLLEELEYKIYSLEQDLSGNDNLFLQGQLKAYKEVYQALGGEKDD